MYVVDKFPSYSETFVSTEMSSLMANGTRVSVYSIHPPDARFKGVAPYVAPPVTAWRMLVWVLPGVVLLALHVVLGLRMDMRNIPKLIFAAAHAARLAAVLHFARSNKEKGLVLHAHFLARPTDVAALASLWVPHTPVLVTSHAGDAKDRRDPKLRRWRTNSADHILAASQYVSENLTADQQDLPVSIVHCGIDVSKLPRAIKSSPTDEHLVVVTVARLIATKGYERAIGIVGALARSSRKPVHWHVVGDGPERQSLEDSRDLLSEAGVTVVLHGALDHESTLSVIAKCDLFLLPSAVTSEDQNAGDGIPVAILESMALGKLVVSTRAGGIPEAVVDGTTGLLMTTETDDEIAARILNLLKDDHIATKISFAAKEKIQSEFLADASAQAIESIVSSSIAHRILRNDAK